MHLQPGKEIEYTCYGRGNKTFEGKRDKIGHLRDWLKEIQGLMIPVGVHTYNSMSVSLVIFIIPSHTLVPHMRPFMLDSAMVEKLQI